MKYLFIVVLLAIAGFLIINIIYQKVSEPTVGSNINFTVTAQNVIGSKTAPLGLSANLTPDPGKALMVKGCDKVTGGFTYLPQENNAYPLLLIEASLDDGSTFFPMSVNVAGTNEIDVYSDSGTGMGVATSGIPYVLVGDKTTVAGRGVTSTLPGLELQGFTHLRFSAKETYTSASGTLWVQAGCAR